MDKFIYWMTGVTVMDWVLHILALIATIYISVPNLWRPRLEKYLQERKERKERENAQFLETPDTPQSN